VHGTVAGPTQRLIHRVGRVIPDGEERVMKRTRLVAGVAALALCLGGAAPAFAAPDFGPGNSQKGPNDGGAKCHPPGQTVNEPGCK
jgi:hypothetical protein